MFINDEEELALTEILENVMEFVQFKLDNDRRLKETDQNILPFSIFLKALLRIIASRERAEQAALSLVVLRLIKSLTLEKIL